MSKSIGERAKEFAQNFEIIPKNMDCGNCDTCGKCKNYERYVDIVTEQKNIDIEKAKIAFSKACGRLSTYLWYNAVVEEFVKALEEQI